jgi:enoyl-CoA hydratase/carnithine racemase
MEYRDVRFEVDDGVAIVTLHRPDQLNAFSGRMGQELGHAWRRCDGDDAVRAVVVTGAGPAFCAGADMSAGGDPVARRDVATCPERRKPRWSLSVSRDRPAWPSARDGEG